MSEYRKLVYNLDVGDGAVMSLPDPKSFDDGGLEWCLRYTCPNLPNNVNFQAASVVESLTYLLDSCINQAEAFRRLKLMRRSFQERAHD